MFDTKKEFTVQVQSGGTRSATVRWPTDEELFDRIRRFRSVRRDVGRGLTQFDIINLEEVEMWLFEKIRVDAGGDAFDKYEAADAIGKLLKADSADMHRNGSDTYVVAMDVTRDATVRHTLRMPTQRDIVEYRREAMRTLQGRRHQDVRMSLEPAARLWDKLQAGVEGYESGSAIPVNHKERAVLDVMDEMQTLEAEGSGPEV